jgi:hypothetical protein
MALYQCAPARAPVGLIGITAAVRCALDVRHAYFKNTVAGNGDRRLARQAAPNTPATLLRQRHGLLVTVAIYQHGLSTPRSPIRQEDAISARSA